MRDCERYKVIDYLGVKFISNREKRYVVFSLSESGSSILWRRYTLDGRLVGSGKVQKYYRWYTHCRPEGQAVYKSVMLSAASPDVRAAYENYKQQSSLD